MFIRVVAILAGIFFSAGLSRAASLPGECVDDPHELLLTIILENRSSHQASLNWYDAEDMDGPVIEDNRYRHQFKKKKRLRSNSIYSIRSGSKEYQEPPQYFLPTGYIKPWFLQQLHKYLFRLKPF